MKTHNYSIDLMVPMQLNRDFVFNEAIAKLDSCSSIVVESFIDKIPDEAVVGQRFIHTKDQTVVYCLAKAKGWQTLKPFKSSVLFVVSEKKLYLFDGQKWSQLDSLTSQAVSQEKFHGIDKSFVLDPNRSHFYLYMNSDCKIDIPKSCLSEITMMIKQNYQATYKLDWSNNILWPKGSKHQLTQTSNSIDLIKLHRLVEIDYFVAEIIGCGYQL